MAKQKRVKRRLNFKALIIFLLALYLIVMLFYALLNRRIKNIYINNTQILTDNEIIESGNLKDYPSLLKLNTKKLKTTLSALDFVSDVTIKKDILASKLIIDIQEAKPLFYNRSSSKVVLSNTKETSTSLNTLGIPTLINYVPTDLLNDFIAAFKEIDPDIIKMINEIEYNPDIKEGITIDNNRFLLRMNDTNTVYVNILNMKRLNNYKEVFATIKDQRGTLYLDSYDSSNDLLGLFVSYESTNQGSDNQDDKLPN